MLGKLVSPNCSDPASQLKVFPSNVPFDLEVLPGDFLFDVYFGKYWIESGQPWSEIDVAFGKRRFGQGGSDKFLRSSVSAFSKLLKNQFSMRRVKWD